MISEFLALRNASSTHGTDELRIQFVRDAADLLQEYVGDDRVAADIEHTLENALALPDSFAHSQALRELVAAVEVDLAHRGFGVVWSDGYMIATTWDAEPPLGTA